MIFNKHNMEVAKFASKGSSRPELQGIFITKDKTVATDSFRLLEVSTPKDKKPEDYKNAMRGMKPVIINAEYLKKNIKLKDDCIAIKHIDDNKIEVLQTVDGQVLPKFLPRITSGEFPEYNMIFPKNEARAEVLLDARLLSDLLEVMGKMNNTGQVRIKVYAKGQPLVIEGGSQNQPARAMLMGLKK